MDKMTKGEDIQWLIAVFLLALVLAVLSVSFRLDGLSEAVRGLQPPQCPVHVEDIPGWQDD